jgi:hypothetical protein
MTLLQSITKRPWLFLLVWLLPVPVLGAQAALPTRVTSPVPVTISNSGNLYSTFELAKNPQYHDEIKKQTGSLFPEILLYCEEASWPAGISSFSARDSNRPAIARYNARLVAIFETSYAIVQLPVAGNEGMPAGMVPQGHPIYFIIGTAGITPR